MRLLVALAVLLPLAACDTAEPESLQIGDLSTDPSLLIGTWDLVSTTTAGFGAPIETTEVSAGTETYTFRADGTVTITREGQGIEENVWAVEELEMVGVRLRIGTETDYRRLFFGVTAARFYIDYRPSDGSLYEYARR